MKLFPGTTLTTPDQPPSEKPSTPTVEPFPTSQITTLPSVTPSGEPSKPPPPSRLHGTDLYQFRRLQLDLDEAQASLTIAGRRLEAFGQLMKEKLGFSDDYVLNPDGEVVSRQAWEGHTQLRPASLPDNETAT